ncbi:hypothetical protein [Desulfurispira natronophila]|uniref:Uncharacterized protein n=1 Tax=Desulfurispira natronophila TaxID=682562 RepID=A0A7W8DGT9_9BACT|nr:hypothetical protein [Desulfurispira natronophila]MBB5021856.1 hypothetical protein [Desulfurispira natronophila]
MIMSVWAQGPDFTGGHAPNIMDAMGDSPAPKGVVLVFRPLGEGGQEYKTAIPPDHWSELLPW